MPRSSGTRPKGSGIPARGPGWGGEAKGASASRIKPGDPQGIQAMSNDPDIKARRKARAADMEDVLYRIATAGEHEANMVSAAVKLHAIIEGAPTQRQEHTGADGEPLQHVVMYVPDNGRDPA